MKAAASPALLPPSSHKAAAGGRTAAAGAPRSAAAAGERFSRIVSAKLHSEAPKAPRAAQPAAAKAQLPAPEVGQADQAAGQLPVPAEAAAAQGKKRAARTRAAAEVSLAGQLAPGAVEAHGQPAATGARPADPRGAEAVTAAPATRLTPQPRLVVLDLRSAVAQPGAEARAAVQAGPGQSAGGGADARQGGVAAGAAPRESTGSVRAGRGGHVQAGPAQGPFESALDRLRGMAGSELVRHSGVVLRDGGGEIRLVLKPESLGSIRIRMNLVDNGIEGRIIVDSPAVKQVLDGSMDALMKALTAQGFQTASLEVAVGGQGADRERQEDEALPLVRRQSAESFERSVPGIEGLGLGDLLVNLFV